MSFNVYTFYLPQSNVPTAPVQGALGDQLQGHKENKVRRLVKKTYEILLLFRIVCYSSLTSTFNLTRTFGFSFQSYLVLFLLFCTHMQHCYPHWVVSCSIGALFTSFTCLLGADSFPLHHWRWCTFSVHDDALFQPQIASNRVIY